MINEYNFNNVSSMILKRLLKVTIAKWKTDLEEQVEKTEVMYAMTDELNSVSSMTLKKLLKATITKWKTDLEEQGERTEAIYAITDELRKRGETI